MSSYGLEVLAREECLALLRTQSIGRVAVRIGDQPAIFPIAFAMLDDDVVFRTDPGTKLIAAVLHTRVVFEVDETDPPAHAGWDVNVVGHAAEILDQPTLERVDRLGLEPWTEGARDRWVRIPAEQVTGRRIRAHEG